jgi:proline iminopeptidase
MVVGLGVAGLTARSGAQPVAHKTAVVKTAQVDLAYETFGSRNAGLPILAINGGPGLAHAYMVENDIWERIARHRLVVLYDQRGTGGSKRMSAGAPQTMEAQVADLEAIRAALGIERVAVLGDSYGGLIAAAYAAAHPEHVAKLILSDSPGASWTGMVHLLPDVFPDIEEADAADEKRLGEDTDAAARAGLRNHFKMIFYSPEKRDEYMAKMGDLGYEPKVGEAVSKATEGLDLSDKLKDFTQFPTLVLSGRYDMNVAPLTAWKLAHAIPGGKVVFFEKSGHLPAYEEEARYQRVLEEFLDAR